MAADVFFYRFCRERLDRTGKNQYNIVRDSL